ncbi:MAG TPA: hypothetical protein VK178_12310 [Opitutaceae bacterium]|nr:hypothetical protein [Opitutaceae bacterium]
MVTPRILTPLAAALLILTGCNTTNRVAVPAAAAPSLGGTASRVLVPNPEVSARIPGSNIAGASIAACSAVPGGFLVGAIIGAASSGADSAIENRQAKTAETLVTPIRNVLVGVDTPEQIAAELRAAFAGNVQFQPELLVLDRQAFPKKDVIKTWLEQAPHRTLLLVRCDYYFTADFGRLVVDATVDLITDDGKLRALGTKRFLPFPGLYHNYLATDIALSGTSRDKEANAAAWAARGEALRGQLAAAVRELTTMIAYDLQQPATATEGGTYEERVMVPMLGGAMVQGGGVQMKARQERIADSRRWLRAKTGELFSVE